MPTVASPIRFGVFEVDLRSGELRKSGVRIHLAEQPLQVLAVLLEHPGEVVTRDELRRRLWPEHTFVDFENGLNAAVKRLREGLGDSAEHPRFVETIPRRGYRFIAAADEIKPEAQPVEARGPRARAMPRKVYVVAAVLLTLAVVSLVAWRIFVSSHRSSAATTAAVQSIAVLPFADMSPEKDQAYFADGLADELITNLAGIPELQVSSRTSSFQFRGDITDARQVGEKLHVKSIVEGGVRKYGNRVRITVQLVNAATGFQVWANTFDGELTDIFLLQAEIAKAVAESLKVSLLAQTRTAQPADSNDVESYNAYLQGRYFAERRSREDMEKAVQYYEKAIRLNPNSARAWAGLAVARTNQADVNYVPVEEGYGKARVEVERALALDPNLARAHECMGWIKMAHDWNWEGANASFQRALALEPGSATTMWGAARLAKTMASFERALELDRRAVELNPLDTTAYLNLGDVAYYMGKYDEAAGALKKSLELNPQFPVARAYLGRVYLMQGRAAEALAVMEQETEGSWRRFGLALANDAMGRRKESDAALAEFMEKDGSGFAYQIAQVYAYRGQADSAFQWLDRAYNQRDGGLTEVKGDPLLRKVQGDPRYAALLNKMNVDGTAAAVLGSVPAQR